ncbi:1,4-alpha-glucan branching protein GlgB [Paenibacillus koleovorans]|uniref:1,4-alpha-glucan branching protein GlgB n=1 Tax=Paenibacillus koleovorans TaxID=121608 RepID=UPI001FE5E134|nr:1,4-alpha-glucan branching protein GlgB [Paenibacillus koleovorans]
MNVNLVDMKDLYLFNTGELYEAYKVLGAHYGVWDGAHGVRFAVWAPNAASVSVAGEFNGWQGDRQPMERLGDTGVWFAFVPGLGEGTAYKYEIVTPQGEKRLKADPFAFHAELRPGTASVVRRLDRFVWTDGDWRSRSRSATPWDHHQRPMLIYEVHLGSWRNRGREQFYSYSELAVQLVDYVVELGFTHIEILPLTEHPLDASWGYQATGYFAATSRYGTPEQLMELVNRAHERGIGVILDWVPGHFCKDDHGLRLFDGTPLYEPADPRLAEKELWGTLAFDFAKSEVVSFLLSGAMFWLDVFHIDGLRVDAVASMIDRNFDKPEPMRTYTEDGGSELREAVRFLRKLNETVHSRYPAALMMAEDSSSYPLVSMPVYAGGLGFGYKWNMGWMNDMLRYMELSPDSRRHHHRLLTFSMMYAYSERFVLPLSHDEVVHGKRSLLNKMPGSYDEKFAQLRLFLAYWIGHPGKKLLFMGGELAQFDEWKDAGQLDWMLLDYPHHRSLRQFMQALAHLYRSYPALWEADDDPAGFEWIDPNNAEQSVVSFVRRARGASPPLVFVCNFSNREYAGFRIGVPAPGMYRRVFSTSPLPYTEKGEHVLQAQASTWQGRDYSLEFPLPALTCLIIEPASFLSENES